MLVKSTLNKTKYFLNLSIKKYFLIIFQTFPTFIPDVVIKVDHENPVILNTPIALSLTQFPVESITWEVIDQEKSDDALYNGRFDIYYQPRIPAP